MTKLVGILNYAQNAFVEGSGRHFALDKALRQIRQLFQDGAEVVNIGSFVTSYGAKVRSQEEEWRNLQPILQECTKIHNNPISVDTYDAEIAAQAINMGVTWIHDISKNQDAKMLELIAANPHVRYSIMYNNADNVEKNYQDILEWGQLRIYGCLAAGIQKDQLLFDPGLGFSTNSEQSFQVISDIAEYKKLGIQLYIGHSRKFFFTLIANYPPEELDLETVIASIYMLKENVDYLRVHDVMLHKRAFTVWKKLLEQKSI